MIYVLARHEGQYQTWCRRNGLIPGVDVVRLKKMTQIEFRMRVIKLDGWIEGLNYHPEDMDNCLLSAEAVVTRVSDW